MHIAIDEKSAETGLGYGYGKVTAYGTLSFSGKRTGQHNDLLILCNSGKVNSCPKCTKGLRHHRALIGMGYKC